MILDTKSILSSSAHQGHGVEWLVVDANYNSCRSSSTLNSSCTCPLALSCQVLIQTNNGPRLLAIASKRQQRRPWYRLDRATADEETATAPRQFRVDASEHQMVPLPHSMRVFFEERPRQIIRHAQKEGDNNPCRGHGARAEPTCQAPTVRQHRSLSKSELPPGSNNT
ncbi:hypothetical protein BD289DRAFT_185402 [Coniella lustricola]|uniref:Uncharacterized protein n=1 Tax=Coniella lustricola TaxID=2025994 RepID=A0A2T2ZT54_9PEZI|nr:hypothetical protein BD289DRAFT_185402 [Coniella lustricola]